MKILLSPAKSIDIVRDSPTDRYSMPVFMNEAMLIHNHLKGYSAAALARMMKVSMSIAQLNYNRNQEFSPNFTPQNAKAAIYAFSGDVYLGFDAYSLAEEKIDVMQNTVRILSGLYGLLKPLDLIQPYRLEMGTAFSFDHYANLYQFWLPKIAQQLNNELQNECVVNLASVEYFKAVDKKILKSPVISPVFKDRKSGEYKVISFYAKRARGMMARYIVENNIQQVEDIKGFDYQGYQYMEHLTKSENEPVFARN